MARSEALTSAAFDSSIDPPAHLLACPRQRLWSLG